MQSNEPNISPKQPKRVGVEEWNREKSRKLLLEFWIAEQKIKTENFSRKLCEKNSRKWYPTMYGTPNLQKQRRLFSPFLISKILPELTQKSQQTQEKLGPGNVVFCRSRH
jgi:hypothetical protein